MNSYEKTKIANQALDYLKANYPKHKNQAINTAGLWTRSGANADGVSHLDFRSVLNKLVTAGKLHRQGTGKFFWMIAVDSCDRSYPFTKTNPDPKPDYTKHTDRPDLDDDVPVPKFNHNVPHFPTGDSDEVKALKARITELEVKVDKLETTVEEHAGQIKDVKSMAMSSVKTLVIKHEFQNKEVKLKDKTIPKVFQQVFDLAKCRRNIMLVGPAGCGKTYLAKFVADSLALDFASISCTAGMSEAHLLGRAVPDLTHGKNRFQGTDFLKVYEDGGIGLLDELDAADPNLLLAVNSGLANGYMNVPNRPDKPVAKRSKNFVCIGTANTIGRGASRMYQGRNQLDEATLDRFRIGFVECDYDEAVEAALCPDEELRVACQRIRTKINATGLRRIMSSRFMEDGYIMMKHGGWSAKQVIETFFSGWTPEEKAKVAG